MELRRTLAELGLGAACLAWVVSGRFAFEGVELAPAGAPESTHVEVPMAQVAMAELPRRASGAHFAWPETSEPGRALWLDASPREDEAWREEWIFPARRGVPAARVLLREGELVLDGTERGCPPVSGGAPSLGEDEVVARVQECVEVRVDAGRVRESLLGTRADQSVASVSQVWMGLGRSSDERSGPVR